MPYISVECEVSGNSSKFSLELRVFGHGGDGTLELQPAAAGDVLLKREDHQAIQVGAKFGGRDRIQFAEQNATLRRRVVAGLRRFMSHLW